MCVGKAKNLKSLCDEESIAAFVGLLSLGEIVAFSIKLDDQFRGVAGKVGDVASDWDPTSKAKAIDSMRTDVAPE